MIQSSRERNGRNGLAILLICLACWNYERIAPSFQAILLQSESQQHKEVTILSSPSQNFHFKNTTKNVNQSPLRHANFSFDFPLCLVHVGKAAGSSLSCGLGLMYADCEGIPRDPPLPNTYYFHMKKDTCRPVETKAIKANKTPIATFLIPVRNPLTRIQSWFNFEKDIIPARRNKEAEERIKWKRGMLFSECYNDFVELVVHGLAPDLWNATVLTERPVNMTCPERAWAAILGVRDFSYHEWYNYEYYWTALQDHYPRLFQEKNDTSSGATLLVLRTEHLLDDWSKISREKLYRQVNQGNRTKSLEAQEKQSSVTLSKENSEAILGNRATIFWKNLCSAMCPEMQIYKQILWHGSNLNNTQVQISIQELQQLCPEEDNRIRSCPEVPKFTPLLVPHRQYKTEVKKRLFAIA